MRVVLSLSVVVAALALVGLASAGSQSYMDSTGEVPGSADVSGVSVTDDGGTITFQTQTTLGDWAPNTFFAILVDSDQNSSTGTAGYDYIVTGDHHGGTVVNTATHVVVQTSSSLSNGLWTASLPASAIGNPPAFNFFVLTQTGPDPTHPYEDRAPNTGNWTYPAVAPPPPPPPPVPAPTVTTFAASYVAAPTHGKAFRVYGMHVTLSDGSGHNAKRVACTATLAGRQFLGGGLNGCYFKLPKTAKAKRLVVKVTGSYGAATLAKTCVFRVR